MLVAKIKERQQASREFEQAKAVGKSASLLEQERPNVFTMSLANVMPGDRVEVELTYTEILVPTVRRRTQFSDRPRYTKGAGGVIAGENPSVAHASLEGMAGDRDFILDYRLAGGATMRRLFPRSPRLLSP